MPKKRYIKHVLNKRVPFTIDIDKLVADSGLYVRPELIAKYKEKQDIQRQKDIARRRAKSSAKKAAKAVQLSPTDKEQCKDK